LDDSSLTPANITFFQIKGKEPGTWTTAALAKKKGEAPQTIVGKMYHHSLSFAQPMSAVFVSNASFAMGLSDGTESGPDNVTIALKDLSADDRKKLATALDLDFPQPRTPDETVFIKFERTDVPVKGCDLFLIGKLTQLLEGKKIGSFGGLYRFLIATIYNKANDTTACATLSDVFFLKSMSRADFEASFVEAEERDSILQNWQIIDDELKAASRNAIERIKLKTAVIDYLRNCSKRTAESTALKDAIKPTVESMKSSLEACGSVLNAADLVRGSLSHLLTVFGELNLEAALLTEIYEVIHASTQ